MTQDEIIAMAREAGWDEHNATYDTRIERFAALVAEHWIETNKALAKEIIELKKQADISALPIIIEAAVKEAVLAEREACAKVCDLVAKEIDDTNGLATYCAAAIRARGEK